LTSNTSIIAIISCLNKLGLNTTVLQSMDKTKPCTLRFDASTTAKFIKEVTVDVPVQRSYEETETINSKSKKGTFEQTKTKVMKVRGTYHVFFFCILCLYYMRVYTKLIKLIHIAIPLFYY